MLERLLRTLVGWGKTGKPRKTARPVFQRARLAVEMLEHRCLMTTTAAITAFSIPSGNSPFGVAAGPDGNVWFTEKAGEIGMINPTTHAVSEFPIPTSSGSPTGITAGPDGNLWFTESSASQIGVINPLTDTVTEFATPTSNSDPTSIVAGPDGNLWFTEAGANKIGMINPTTHVITEFTVPTSGSSPNDITVGPDGQLWFTENAANKIAAINPLTHTFTEYVIPQANSQPSGIAAGADGNIYFTESNANKIGELNLATHVITSFSIGGTGEPRSITAAADGNLWFTEIGTNQIGVLNLPGDTINLINVPTANSSPAWIGVGPGGTLWFAESNASQIAEVVESPTITEMPTSQTVTASQTATFTAEAIGFPAPTVQWQVSTNGGETYTPLTNTGVYSGVNTDTLTVTDPPTTMTGYLYEAVFSDGVTATTLPVTLTVNNALSISPPPPEGVVNTLYDQTLSVVGSTSPFTLFAVNNFNAGNTGLTVGDITTNTINGTITIEGTPSNTGIISFTVSIANTAGNSLTQTISILINPPLSIATTSLPQATAGDAYNQTISVIGGAMPYSLFAVTNFNAGTTGLTMSDVLSNAAAGTIAIDAIPLAAGTATFTVDVTDAQGTVATKDYTITVNPALAITPSLPQGTADTNYDQTLNVSGGGTPYASLTITGFSGGTTGLTAADITASPTAGTFTIDGTPTAAGKVTFTANVTDAIGAVLSKTYTVTINPPLAITANLPQGTADAVYQHAISVTGGSTPYTTFSVTGFSAGTTGLTAANVTVNTASGTVLVSGTPSAAGTLAFTVNVGDSAGSTLAKTYSVTINPPLAVTNLTTTQWTKGSAGFTGSMTISGGTGPIAIASDSGLPAGMTLSISGNTLSFAGMPSTTGVYAAGSVTLKDAAGATITKTFSITINATPTINTLSATQWTIGRSGFSGTMSVAGGTGGLTIASSSGLPTGLSLMLSGSTLSFTGTPTATGTFNGSVTLVDAIGAKVTRTFSITINAAPTIGNLAVTQWTAGKSGFTGTLTILNGTTPHAITSATGLPTGMSATLSGTTIKFAGTPTTAGTYTASITITDAAGATATKTFTITINPPVRIVTTSLAASMMGRLYTTTLQTTGGTGAITFKITAGSLPPGYALNSNGMITGVSRGVGKFTFTVTATDADGATVTETYTLTVGV